MDIFYRLTLTLAVVAVFAAGQGSGGGGSSGGGSSGSGSSGTSYGSNGGSPCTGDGCARTAIIAGSVIGGIFGLAAIVFGSIFVCRRCKGKQWRSNASFVNRSVPKNQTYQQDHFTSGGWSSQYHQYGTWHGPHQCSLQFDRTGNKVTGEGNDDVGRFTVDGTFSVETHRMGLTKSYQLGTGNPAENSGHKVTLQLTWNNGANQFEGKWYVQTKKYQGGGDFQLKFNDHDVISSEKLDG